MKVASFFAGCGGLDLGFERAGFKVAWANEFDRTIVPTLQANFPKTKVISRSISEIAPNDVPDVDGIVGGPPCQSWSIARGSKEEGCKDKRGLLFWDYVRIIERKMPSFFVAENVAGMLTAKNRPAFDDLLNRLNDCGYHISWQLMYCPDFGVPQIRKRIIIVGMRRKHHEPFSFPAPLSEFVMRPRTISDAIGDLKNARIGVNNHECGPMHPSRLPPQFMEQNRVEKWDWQARTIPASQDYIRFHPDSPEMERVGPKRMRLAEGKEDQYRRLSIRECARLQTFPDDFCFIYKSTAAGYRMVGNAVPPALATYVAGAIREQL